MPETPVGLPIRQAKLQDRGGSIAQRRESLALERVQRERVPRDDSMIETSRKETREASEGPWPLPFANPIGLHTGEKAA